MSDREQPEAETDYILISSIQWDGNTLERYTCIYFSSLKPSKTMNSLHLCSLELDFIRSREIIGSLVYYYQNLKMAGSLN
jgi:hypothetical protein